jgi:hypothetical protein
MNVFIFDVHFLAPHSPGKVLPCIVCIVWFSALLLGPRHSVCRRSVWWTMQAAAIGAAGASDLHLGRRPLADSDDLNPIGILPDKRANLHYAPVISKNCLPFYIF